MIQSKISILIPNRFSWDGIILTIESIRKRTNPNIKYEIIVADNSLAPNNKACEPSWIVPDGRDDGNRRDYLRSLAGDKIIQLIENTDQDRKYGHGENIRLMMNYVETPYAMVFNSSSEILRADWLDILLSSIRDVNKDLGVAEFHPGGARNHDFITSVYWPNMMLLNMRLYRRFYPENNWDLEIVAFEDFHRPELFTGQYPKNPERTPPWVFCDTGWRLWEKMAFNNPDGVRILPLPNTVRYGGHPCIKGFGGLDRCAHHVFLPSGDAYNKSHVATTLTEINQRLAMLRMETL